MEGALPRNNGIYNLPPGYFATAGTPVMVSQHNPPLEDIEQALTESLPRDGTAPMTGNLPMGNNRITGLSPATAGTHAVRFDQVVPKSGGEFTGTIRVPRGNTANNGIEFAPGTGINWTSEGPEGTGIRFAENGTTIGRLRSGTALPTSLDIVTRGSGDLRYIQNSWTLTAGAGLTGGGDGTANRTLAVDNTVVRTSRQVSTGNGLRGGGNLSADRTLQIDLASLPFIDGAVGLSVPRLVATDGTTTGSEVRLGENPLRSNFNLPDSRTSIGAGAGLTSSGTLGNSPSVAMGTPSSITRTSTNSASGNTHTHNLPQAAFRDMMANYIVPGQLGSYVFAGTTAGAGPVNFNQTISGGSLRPSNAGGVYTGSALGGTWVCCGATSASGEGREESTSWLRIL